MGRFPQTITLRPGKRFLEYFKDFLEKRLMNQPTHEEPLRRSSWPEKVALILRCSLIFLQC